MTVQSRLIDTDYKAFHRHVMFRYRRIHWIYLALLVLMLSLTWYGGEPEETVRQKIHTLVGAVIVFGGVGLLVYGLIRAVGRFAKTNFGGTLGEHVFEVGDDGLIESNSNGRIETRLGGIRRVDETARHFFVITTAGLGHVIPKRDLADIEPLRVLAAKVKERRCQG